MSDDNVPATKKDIKKVSNDIKELTGDIQELKIITKENSKGIQLLFETVTMLKHDSDKSMEQLHEEMLKMKKELEDKIKDSEHCTAILIEDLRKDVFEVKKDQVSTHEIKLDRHSQKLDNHEKRIDNLEIESALV